MVSKITALIRNLINDNSQSDNESVSWTTGNSMTLAQENVSSITSITKNGDVVSTDDYSFSVSSVTVSFESGCSPSSGDTIIVYYVYNKYSNSEILAYIKSALAYLSINQYHPNFELNTAEDSLYPIPSQEETKLIAMVASILIQPNWSRFTLAGTTTVFPRTKSKDDKIKEVISVFKRSNGIIGIIDLS